MANRFYQKGVQHFEQGDISLTSNNIKCVLVSSAYTPATGTSGDEFLSTITGASAVVATSPNMASKSCAGGVFTAANLTFSSVSGAQVLYVVMYQDTGSASTSQLICIFDTANNLPVTPNGGNITIQWDPTNGIFIL